MTEDQAREMFRDHCQPGSRGALEHYGEKSAIAAIIEATSVRERNDVRRVDLWAPFEGDGGHAYVIGFDGVTEIRVAKRHGPLDWIPYVEVYQGDHLYAEMPQHNTLCVEFAKVTAA